MCGLRSEAVQKRLLTESALTLDKAIEISVSMELAAKEACPLSSTGKLHKVYTEEKGRQNKCYRCDKTGHLATDCWSKDVECRKCKKKDIWNALAKVKQFARKQNTSTKTQKTEVKRDALFIMCK